MRVRGNHSLRTLAIVAGVAIACVTGPAFGAKDETTNGSGGSTDPEPGSTVETTWNPTNQCAVLPQGESMGDLYSCLASWIDPTWFCQPGNGGVIPPPGSKTWGQLPDPCNPPPEWDSRGDFIVHYLYAPPNQAQGVTGIEIVRHAPDDTGSTEPVQLILHKKSHNLTRSRIELNRPDYEALIRIHPPATTPAGGLIQVTLNGRTVPGVATHSYSTLNGINQTLLSRIQAAGFAAMLQEGYIVVSRDGINGLPGVGLTSVALNSTDPGLTETTLKLISNATVFTVEEDPGTPPPDPGPGDPE